MKEVFLKFLDTQNFATILAEITAMFMAWQGWKKYSDETKKKKESNLIKALDGSEKINSLLLELQKSFSERNTINAIIEITNGGGIIKENSALYMKVLNSTNNEIMQLWGSRSLVVSEMAQAIKRLIINSTSHLDMTDFKLKKVDFWSGAKNINRVHYFVIGHRKRATRILAINTEEQDNLTDEELLIAYTYAASLKDEFNSSRRFWQDKLS